MYYREKYYFDVIPEAEDKQTIVLNDQLLCKDNRVYSSCDVYLNLFRLNAIVLHIWIS